MLAVLREDTGWREGQGEAGAGSSGRDEGRRHPGGDLQPAGGRPGCHDPRPRRGDARAAGVAGDIPDRASTRTTCAVYTDYRDGGRFRCLVGAEVTGAEGPPAGLAAVTVPAGEYLVFAARGPMPAALATTWGRVAEFFEHADMTRAFTADLEVHYPAGSAVDVFVAIADG